MSALSILLGKVIGIYFILGALWAWKMRKDVHRLTKKFNKYPTLLMFMGPIVLIAGLFLVLGHNLWVGDWRVVVTIAGWLTLLKGLTIMFLPEQGLKLARAWNEKSLSLAALVMLVLGVWVAWGAFGA